MILVPSGTVLLGTPQAEIGAIVEEYDHHPYEWYEDETPQQPKEVSSFLIDKYPVTNHQFAGFVEQTGYETTAERMGYGFVYMLDYWEQVDNAHWRHPQGSEDQDVLESRLDHPVVHIAHVDALAYASWAGKRLPTEVEWERAAKGDEHKLYPWGNHWDPNLTNSAEYWIREPVRDLSTWKDWWKRVITSGEDVPKTTPVGQFHNESVFGVYDLSGNVYEMCQDTYERYDPNKKYDGMYEAIFGMFKVVRGGSWMNFRYQTRCSERIAVDPHYSNFATGFRCAKDIEV